MIQGIHFSNRTRPVSIRVLILLSFCVSIGKPKAQEIPIGTWRLHLSYNSITSATAGDGKIYGAAETGIVVVENDNSIHTYSKLTGLTGATISYINFNEATHQLVVAYADGNLDILQNNSITNFAQLKNSTVLIGSKRINHILFKGTLAYLATDYGVVVFDLAKNEVKETWRDLGAAGGKLAIMQSTFLGDSILLATSKGILIGNIRDNLLDYSKWKRFDTNEFATSIQGIATQNKTSVFATVNGTGLFRYEVGTWSQQPFLIGENFQSIQGASNLLITEASHVWQFAADNTLTELTSPLISKPLFAVETTDNKILIGDTNNGLLIDNAKVFTNYIPSGPTFLTASKLRINKRTLYALRGGFSASMQPIQFSGEVNVFTNGTWTSETSPLMDITDLTFKDNALVASSFGGGIQKGSIGSPDIIYNTTNSTLINTGVGINVTALTTTAQGVWVANYGANASLHLLKTDNTWQAFGAPSAIAKYPINLLGDDFGSVWAIINPSQGGGLYVFNKDNQLSTYLSKSDGIGGLPDGNVLSLALDHDGYMWVGTAKGVGYFASPSQVFKPGVNLIKPIFENRYLLATEKIAAIAVDGGNRKWMGTTNGAWLVGAAGDNLVYNFTEANSPLPSSNILDIAIDAASGEVFFATDRGIASYRSTATAPSDFTSVKIFPNPVLPSFNGNVGISGLAANAFVKITDVSGKLIWNTTSNGGTATWNVRDYNGHRASTGIYLVFSTTLEGTESYAGKIAVIE